MNGCGAPQEVLTGTVVIEGDAVKAAASFTLEELKSMEEGLVEADYVSINSYGTKEYFHYKGVWVWHIIKEKVSLRDNAAKVSFIAEDEMCIRDSYYGGGVQYPSCAGLATKWITEVRVYSIPQGDWTLELDGEAIGGLKYDISKTYFEQALACQFGADHLSLIHI